MDIKQELLTNVLTQLQGDLSDSDLRMVQDTLIMTLNNYEVQARCTELTTSDNGSELMFRKYIATKRIEGLSENSIKRYAYINKQLVDYLSKPLSEITVFDIRFYLTYKKEVDNLSDRTLDGMRRCYSSFFSWLTAEGFIQKNPCLALKAIKRKKTIKKPFSAEELERIRKVCSSKRDIAIVDFLYSTGCRVSELVSINICDIDFANKEGIVLGKGDKERTIYISEVAMMNLKEYLSSRNDKNRALFIGRGGKRLSKTGVEALLRKLGKQANVDNVHPHRFRRTLATNLLNRGMSIQDVAQILGHSDLKTTQIYCSINQANTKASYFKYAA